MIVRFVEAGEEVECNDFHNRQYCHRRSLAQWRWEFTPTIFQCPPVPFAVAVDKGRIVGTQALIPIRMIDKDGVFWTAKSEETLVDPVCRGQDLSVKMYQLLFKYAEQKEIATVWGFTTATKALQRSGFTVSGATSQLFFPLSTRSIRVLFEHEALTRWKARPSTRIKQLLGQAGCAVAEVASSLRLAANSRRRPTVADGEEIEIRTLGEPPEGCGPLCERFIRQWSGTTILRDAEYLRWRIYENPWVKSIVRGAFVRGRLQGWVAFGVADDGMGNIVDLMVAAEEPSARTTQNIVRILLAETVAGVRKMGAVGIRGWRVNEHPFDRLVTRVARTIGFYHIRRGGPVVVYLTSHGRRREGLDRFDGWYVTRIYTEGLLG